MCSRTSGRGTLPQKLHALQGHPSIQLCLADTCAVEGSVSSRRFVDPWTRDESSLEIGVTLRCC